MVEFVSCSCGGLKIYLAEAPPQTVLMGGCPVCKETVRVPEVPRNGNP